MEKPNNDIEAIERYLNGEMTGEELIHFEKRMEEDQQLFANVEEIKNLPDSLLDIEKERLSDQVKSWMKAEEETEPKVKELNQKPRVKYLRVAGIAAACIAILFVAGLWLLPFSNQGPNALASNYLSELHHSAVVLRTSTNEQWERSIQAYQNGQFEQMITLMTSLIQNENVTAEQQFYFALAHIYKQREDLDTALLYFGKTEEQDATTYAEELAWYRALIHLKRNENEEVKEELLKISGSNKYGEKVERLMSELGI